MAPDFLPKLAEHGTLGMLLGIALWCCWKLYQENQRLHAERLSDARAAADKTLQMAEAATKAITSQTHTIDGHKQSFVELHATMREYVDEARKTTEAIRDHIEETRRSRPR